LKTFLNVDGRVVVLYLDDHLEGITWFWILVTAGAIPCILPSLPKGVEQRTKKIQGKHIVKPAFSCLNVTHFILHQS